MLKCGFIIFDFTAWDVIITYAYLSCDAVLNNNNVGSPQQKKMTSLVFYFQHLYEP